jgi:hypothetical protein
MVQRRRLKGPSYTRFLPAQMSSATVACIFFSGYFFAVKKLGIAFVLVTLITMVDKMEHDHDHEHEKDSFEPLKAEYYEGKHLSAPVKEIQVLSLDNKQIFRV